MSVNLIGWPFLKAGIGQHLRLVARALETAGVPFVVNDVLHECFDDMSLFQNDDTELVDYKCEEPVHPISIHCLNLNHLDRYDDRYWQADYNICFGYYELSELLSEWVIFEQRLDEVWAPTTFIQSAFSRKLSIPVVHLPIAIEAPTNPIDCRKKYGLHRAEFIFMASMDLRSLVERKNPLAVVRAFRQAMRGLTNNCVLLLKISMTEGQTEQEEYLRSIKKAAGGDRRIRFIAEMLPRAEFDGLLASCDCYVSLHRSEGLGLGMAEAMSLGKAVIATDYSGNRDFMNTSNSLLVPFSLVSDPTAAKIQPGYGDGQVFFYAEPSIDHAAELMRQVYMDRKLKRALGLSARETIKQNFSANTIGLAYRERLDRLADRHDELNDIDSSDRTFAA